MTTRKTLSNLGLVDLELLVQDIGLDESLVIPEMQMAFDPVCNCGCTGKCSCSQQAPSANVSDGFRDGNIASMRICGS